MKKLLTELWDRVFIASAIIVFGTGFIEEVFKKYSANEKETKHQPAGETVDCKNCKKANGFSQHDISNAYDHGVLDACNEIKKSSFVQVSDRTAEASFPTIEVLNDLANGIHKSLTGRRYQGIAK